jgi:hypothetical protein
MQRVIDLMKEPHISGEFVTTMLEAWASSREGLLMPANAQQVAYDALVMAQ